MTKAKELPLAIQRQLIEVDNLSDGLGLPIDDDIRLLVAALRAYGIETVDSCGGHEDRRTNGPRVWVTAGKNKELSEKLYNLDRSSEESYQIRDVMRDNGYHVRLALLNLLDDFYRNHEVSEWIRIILDTRGAHGDFVLICQGTETVDAIESDSRRQEWLKQAKQEFAAFTDFMVERVSQE